MNQKCFLSIIFILLLLNFNIILSQRDFVNPAVTDPAPCSCDVRINNCDSNCCCDPDCRDSDLSVSPVCNSIRTTSSYSYVMEPSSETWNCTNTTSAAFYDYFPFVCVQFKMNEIIGQYYPTRNATFITSSDDATSLRSSFTTTYPDLFDQITLTTSSDTTNYSMNSPVQQSVTTSTLFTLPGNLAGMTCQENTNVLFGVNRDYSCPSSSVTNFCTRVSNGTEFKKGGDRNSLIRATFLTKTAVSSTSTTRTGEFFFSNTSTPNINNIGNTNSSIVDYCPGLYPTARTQRYDSACASSDTSRCANNEYQTWNSCPLRDTFKYSEITSAFFIASTASTDDSINFSDFDNATSATALTCTGSISRVLYRFNYLSASNTISSVQIYVLFADPTTTVQNFRVTIQWIDGTVSPEASTTIPSGYLDGEVLQFRRGTVSSDVSTLVPNGEGLCVDATRKVVRFKRGTLSSCFVQLTQATVQQCHSLKLNMFIYLNTYYAPASHVMAYPSTSATTIQIRDATQEQIDLDRIDETRANNRLSSNNIIQTSRQTKAYTIYDAAKALSICHNVPSGIYIEFGYVRVQVSPTIWFERIVSVQYNYTYSTWEFDCTKTTCDSTTTQRYAVSFQAAFVDLTGPAFNTTTITKSDLTSADNYLQHLLWLITPEYKGEPAYRNYTIAMILIFIAFSVIVMHIILFGIMYPF